MWRRVLCGQYRIGFADPNRGRHQRNPASLRDVRVFYGIMLKRASHYSIKNPAPLGAGFLCGQYRIRTCDPRHVKAML